METVSGYYSYILDFFSVQGRTQLSFPRYPVNNYFDHLRAQISAGVRAEFTTVRRKIRIHMVWVRTARPPLLIYGRTKWKVSPFLSRVPPAAHLFYRDTVLVSFHGKQRLSHARTFTHRHSLSYLFRSNRCQIIRSLFYLVDAWSMLSASRAKDPPLRWKSTRDLRSRSSGISVAKENSTRGISRECTSESMRSNESDDFLAELTNVA